jgi:hypothetical protein
LALHAFLFVSASALYYGAQNSNSSFREIPTE